MNKNYKIVLLIVGVLFAAFMIWYFSAIVVYVLISAVLSMIGHPMVRLFDRIKIWKFSIPHGLSAFLALFIILLVAIGFILVFVPLISTQAKMISEIDINDVLIHFQKPLDSIQEFLIDYNVINANETIKSTLSSQIESMVNIATFSNIFKNIISTTGSFFMGAFSILFITFFFLQDENMFQNFIILLAPEKYDAVIRNVLNKTKKLLTRYFIGLMLELLTIMTLLTIGLSIIGVENALIIGFLGGLMNIVPYLGPIIGCTVGVIFGVSSELSLGLYDQIGLLTTGIISVFLAANLIDNVVLQPLIYSNSVKARPIEIFLVIIMAGSIAGIPGMILAIPTYTVLRIVAKDFLSQFRLVKKITEKI